MLEQKKKEILLREPQKENSLTIAIAGSKKKIVTSKQIYQ